MVFTGSAGEAELIDPILDTLRSGGSLPAPPVSLAGQTGLGALAAVYRRCSLVIGPDSGPLHLAVAVGTPTVHLYGPVDRRTFGPWGSPQRHRVVTSNWACIPCNRLDWPGNSLNEHGCVRDVAVEQVLAEAITLLNAGGSQFAAQEYNLASDGLGEMSTSDSMIVEENNAIAISRYGSLS